METLYYLEAGMIGMRLCEGVVSGQQLPRVMELVGTTLSYPALFSQKKLSYCQIGMHRFEPIQTADLFNLTYQALSEFAIMEKNPTANGSEVTAPCRFHLPASSSYADNPSDRPRT